MISPAEFAALSVDERAACFDCRPFAALKEDHPLVGRVCPLCELPLQVGENPTLLVFDSEENRAAARAAGHKGAYNAEATAAHWTCVTGSYDAQGDFERWWDRHGA